MPGREEATVRATSSRIVLAVWLLIASTPLGAPSPAAAGESAAAPAPTFEELMNLKYSGLGSAGAVKLADGRYENARKHRSVTFVRDFRITGDLSGDGRDDALVLLAVSHGGSGTYSYIAVVGRKGGSASNLSTAPLGDRVQVRDARIDSGRVWVDVLRAGPGDAMCCPGELTTLAWELKGGRLHAVPTGAKTERLSLAAIAGTDWLLRSWAWDDPVADSIDITLAVSGDQVAGHAACNRYFATATAGAQPGDVSFGAAGSSRMACPEPQMGAGARFLARLATVRRYSFMGGQLALSWTEGDKVGTMLFARGPTKP
jgi:heat shock protein HslJ